MIHVPLESITGILLFSNDEKPVRTLLTLFTLMCGTNEYLYH